MSTFGREPLTPHNWPAVHALLAPAMRVCGQAAEELIDEILSGAAQLWVMRKGGDPIAAAVSEIVDSPSGKIVHGRLLSGGGSVGPAIECVKAHAESVGARAIRIEGRVGWRRELGRRGWREAGVIMELPLGGRS